MSVFEEDCLWLDNQGYLYSEDQADEFSDIVTRNYNDGMSNFEARSKAVITMNLTRNTIG